MRELISLKKASIVPMLINKVRELKDNKVYKMLNRGL